MKEFFQAKTIAVIGASREPEKAGHIIFRNLLHNKNLKVIPINPNAPEIIRQKCYASVLDYKDKIDLAIIAIPSAFVVKALEQCGKKKIKSVIIISSGFSESGNFKDEQLLEKLAEKYKIRIIGPNSLGLLSPYQELNASFFRQLPQKGSLAFISQSGAIGAGILDKSIKDNFGLSGFVSVGNCLSLDFSDFIEYYNKDKETKIIALYIESLKKARGARFIETCRKANKPLIVIKSGKTKLGELAAKSHTAALASEQGVYESIFKQARIIELESIRELSNFSLIYTKLGKLGKNALIVTNAGGLGVLASDVLSKSGVSLPELPAKLKKSLLSAFPSGRYNNPLDLLGDATPERYKKVLDFLEKENFFDFYIFLMSPQYMTNPFEISKVFLELKKPALAVFLGGESFDRAKILLRDKLVLLDDVSDLSILGKL